MAKKNEGTTGPLVLFGDPDTEGGARFETGDGSPTLVFAGEQHPLSSNEVVIRGRADNTDDLDITSHTTPYLEHRPTGKAGDNQVPPSSQAFEGKERKGTEPSNHRNQEWLDLLSYGKRPIPIGLNSLNTYFRRWSADGVVAGEKFGDATEPFSDAESMGSTIVRHPGLRDLTWSMMVQDSTTSMGFRLGQQIGPVWAVFRETLSRQIRVRQAGQGNAEWLAEMLLTAHAAGQRLLLTFFTRGGGGVEDLPKGTGMPIDATVGVDWECEVVVDDVTYTLKESSVLPQDWSDAHVGRAEDAGAFPVQTAEQLRDEDGRGYPWHLFSLDVSSPYKRAYLRMIAVEMAQVLRKAGEHMARSGVSLEEVIEGIDLFNEADHYNRYVSASGDVENKESGARWGRACFQAAWGFYSVLGDADNGAGIAIRLPGITSYLEIPGEYWVDRIIFLNGLVQGFVAEAFEHETNLSDGELLDVLPSLLGGIDYHWYHAGDLGSDEEIRHIGFLVTEVQAIEQAFIRFVDGEWWAQTGVRLNVLDSFPVSTMELGVSATRSSEFLPGGVAVSLPRSGDDASCTKRELHQAWEVCRRIGGGLASGARYVGWHAWMTGGTTFAGYGLRNDSGQDDDPASESTQRVGWFVYQRLVSVLSGVETGEMVLPKGIASRNDILAFVRMDDRHPFVVFHYEGTFLITVRSAPTTEISTDSAQTLTEELTFAHAWLALRDPSMRSLSRKHVSALWEGEGKDAEAWVVPFGYTFRDLLLGSSRPSLVSRSVTFDQPTQIDLTTATRFDLDYWDGPVLIVSNKEIAWDVEITAHLEGVSVFEMRATSSKQGSSSHSRTVTAPLARKPETTYP